MIKSSSFEVLVPRIARITPIDEVIYLGQSQSGIIQNCLSKNAENVYFFCHGEAAAKEFKAKDSSNSSYLHPIICSDHDGIETYYRASLASESGFIDPTLFKPFWKNISIKSEAECEVTTLDGFLAKLDQDNIPVDKINWLVVDSLSSSKIISGAKDLLTHIECLVVKLLFVEDVVPELNKSTKKYLTSELESKNFFLVEEVKSSNPQIGYGVYLKDWKKISTNLFGTQSIIEQSHKEAVASLAALDDAHSALKGERDSLEQSHKEAVASLAALDEAHSALKGERDSLEQSHKEAVASLAAQDEVHSALKGERDSLEQSHKEAVASLAALDDAHSALKGERDRLEQSHKEAVANVMLLEKSNDKLTAFQKIIEAQAPEFDNIKAEISHLKNASSFKEELQAVSQTLQETTQSLKLSTQLHIKKEIDYQDLKGKYAKLLKEKRGEGGKKNVKKSPANPIRILHHLSCTGGTLIVKCLAAQPNILLLNEVDPLSTVLSNTRKAEFTPTDLIGLLRQADPNISSELLSRVFREGLRPVQEYLFNQGLTLIGRDHSHGKYLTGDDVLERETFKDIVSQEHETISLVSVRHPIDSFLSLQSNGWDQHFSPSTLEEYCRRYLCFLDDMQGSEIFKYEDFVENPKGTMRKICVAYKITYEDNFIDIFEAFAFSGASGRSSSVIEKRNRRDISQKLIREIECSKSYQALIKRLNY